MDSSSMIRNKVSVSTSGQMGASTRVGGTEANSMELVHTLTARKEQSSTASGRMENASSGLMSKPLS